MKALIGFCLLIAPVAAVAEPVALVLEVQGEIEPPVEPFAELEPGALLTLSPGAAVTLEHYASCEEVTARGGTVGVGARGLDLSAASDVARRPVDCPQLVRLSEAHVNAGVVLRSVTSAGDAGPAQTVGLAPTIIVAGGKPGIDRMMIERDGREVVTLPVLERQVDWPEGTLFLSDGARYRLTLSDGLASHTVDVIADGNAPGRVVLRLSPAE